MGRGTGIEIENLFLPGIVFLPIRQFYARRFANFDDKCGAKVLREQFDLLFRLWADDY